MSAICGAWPLRAGTDAAGLNRRMLDALVRHGPDGLSEASPPHSPIALGHRLLRITAEDALEAQPIALADGLWLVADARIDNRFELARDLAIPTGELAGLADSAVLGRAWERWGRACLDRLAGAFALAVWDSRAETLFLARDHAGERPLYFRWTPESFLFATTARAIRSCPGISSELDDRQLVRDLVGLPPEYPRSRFREIGEIAPGHCLEVTRAGVEHRRHWDIHHLKPTRFARGGDYADAFREVFDEAVRSRLRTTGEVACELSAGLDSSSVAATAAELMGGGRGLTAYTAVPVAGFNGPVGRGLIANEGPYAAEVARLYPGMRHVLLDASGSNMLDELARMFPLLDLPHAAPLNAVWSNLILDDARRAGAKVMLCGALGNFAASYTGADILHTLFRRGRIIETAGTALRMRRMGISSGRNAASLTVFAMLPWRVRRQLDPLVRGTTIDWSSVREDAARQEDARDQFCRYLFTHASALPRLMEAQFQRNQYGDYNAATLAGWGIESRDPTADRRVFEFCASIPPEQFIVGGQGRSLIRRAMRGRLPDSTLDREEKGTQGADYYETLTPIRRELADALQEIAGSPTARRLIDLERLRAAVEDWPADARAAAEQGGVYQSALPRGISVGYFIRHCELEASR